MDKHVEECICYVESCCPWMGECNCQCICDILRTCEQRVAEETEAAMIQSFYWKPSPPHDQHYFADNICAYCVGRSEALDAAREAVAALPCMAGRGQDRHPRHVDDFKDAVLAAIGALKEKP